VWAESGTHADGSERSGPAPLHPAAQVLGNKGPLAPLGDQTAACEAPVGIEMIHHPVVALPLRALLDDGGQMRGAVCTGACLA